MELRWQVLELSHDILQYPWTEVGEAGESAVAVKIVDGVRRHRRIVDDRTAVMIADKFEIACLIAPVEFQRSGRASIGDREQSLGRVIALRECPRIIINSL